MSNLRDGHNISSIQALRGIAALMVVGFHVFAQIERMGFTGARIEALASGVDIFFVISGFIIWQTTTNRPNRKAHEFWRDRLARIIPLYWLMTAFIVVVSIVAPSLLQSTKFELDYVLKSFFFVPTTSPTSTEYVPILANGWTLNFEVFFYLIVSIVIAISKCTRVRAILIVSVLSALVAGPTIFKLPDTLAFYGNNIVLEFAFGIGLGMLYKDTKGSAWGWVAICIGLMLLAAYPYGPLYLPRCIQYGIPATLIVFGALYITPITSKELQLLGDSSYSLYLSHFITMSAAGQLWHTLGGPIGLFPIFSVCACVLVGILIYLMVEKPLTHVVRKTFITPDRSQLNYLKS